MAQGRGVSKGQGVDCPPCPVSARWWERLAYVLGIGLGSGLPRVAPGTWGSLAAFVLACPLLLYPQGFWGLTIMGMAVGAWVCGKTSQLMGGHDNAHIVFDEWVGMWIAMLPLTICAHVVVSLPEGGGFHNEDGWWQMLWLMMQVSFEKGMWMQGGIAGGFLLLPFVLFRLFDVLKPFPIGWADRRVGGGLGILLDDVLAGVMAAVLYTLLALGWFFIVVGRLWGGG